MCFRYPASQKREGQEHQPGSVPQREASPEACWPGGKGTPFHLWGLPPSWLVLPVWKWHLKFVRWLHEVILICCAGCVRHAREVPVSVRKDEFLHSKAYLNVNRSLHVYPQWYCFPDCLPGNSDACENDPFPEWKTVLDPLRQERPGRLPPSADSKTLDNKQVKRLPRIKGVSASPIQYSRAWFKPGLLSYRSVSHFPWSKCFLPGGTQIPSGIRPLATGLDWLRAPLLMAAPNRPFNCCLYWFQSSFIKLLSSLIPVYLLSHLKMK